MAEGRELTPLPTLAPVPRRVVEEYCRESFSTSSSSSAAAQQHALARLGIGVGVGVGSAFTRDSTSASASSRQSPSSWRDSSSSPMSASACMSVSVRESYFDDDLAAVGPVCLGALPRDDDGLGGSLEDSSQCCSNATFSTAPTASASASASGSGAGAGAGAGSGRPLSRSFAGVELDDLVDEEERSRAVGRRDRELSVSCASASASASAGSRGHEAHADAAEGCDRDHCSALEYSLSFDLRAFHALPADESYSERDGCDDEAFSSRPMETKSESQTPTQTLPTRTRLPRDAESGISNPTDATLSPTAAVAVDDEATSAHPCHKSSSNTCNCNPEQCQSRSAVAPAPEAEPEASAGADTDTQASRVVLPEFEMSRVYRLVFAPSRTSLTISTPFHPSQATITDEIQFESASASASAMGSSRCLRHSLLSKSLDFLSVPSRSAAAATTASERSACRRSLSAPQLKRLPHSLLLSSTQSPAASQSTQPPPPPPADTEMPIPSEPSPVPAHSIEPKPEPELERALPHFLLHESIYEDRCHNNTDRTVPYEEHSMLDTDTDADYDYTRVTCATLPLVRRRRSSRSVAGAVAVAPPTSSAISCAPRPLSCCSASSETRRTMPDLSFLCRLPAASASGSGARSPRRKWSASASPAPGAPSLQHRSSHQLLTVSEPPAELQARASVTRSKTLPRVRPTRRAVAFADRVDEQLDPQQQTTRIGALALERPPSLLEAHVGAAQGTRSRIRARAGVTSTKAKANLRDGSGNGCAPDADESSSSSASSESRGRSTSRRWRIFRVSRTALAASAGAALATLAGLVALLLVRPSFSLSLPLPLPVPLALLLELCVRAPLALSLPLLVILSLASFSLLLRILHR